MNPTQIWEELMCFGIEAVTAPRMFLGLWLCTTNIYQAVRELNSQKIRVVGTGCIINIYLSSIPLRKAESFSFKFVQILLNLIMK